MLSRIAQSAGFSFDSFLNEGGSDQPIAAYLEKLKSHNRSFMEAPIKELLTIAALAQIAKRRGMHRVELTKSLHLIVDKLENQSQKPVVSALEAYYGSIDLLRSFVPILYIEKPVEMEDIPPATNRSAQVALIVPTTDNVRRNTREIKGVRMVTASWGFLDALASPGRQPDAAIALFYAANEVKQ